LGYRWEEFNKIGFLTKKNDPNKKNLLFIHGAGFGYVPYFITLMKLEKKYNIVIIVLPNISSYNNYYDELNLDYFPPLNQLTDTFFDFMKNKNITQISVLSHSFGTYIAQILRKDERSKIFDKVIMVDPIIFWIGCFKMSLHVENPFIKKYPIRKYLFDNLISFIVYHCLYLKFVFFRVMFGPDFWVYDASELTDTNVIIVLEKNDDVIPAELLYQKINNKVKNYYMNEEGLYHGALLRDQKHHELLLKIIES
jgi:pimeloyl-ACP methyl ester carboxylesterase